MSLGTILIIVLLLLLLGALPAWPIQRRLGLLSQGGRGLVLLCRDLLLAGRL